MQLTDVQNDLKKQSVFKRKKTQATSREKNTIIVILQDTSHENVENRKNHRVLLLSNEDLKVQSDKCWQSWQNRAQV